MVAAFTRLVNNFPRPGENGVADSPTTDAVQFWICSVHTPSCVCASSMMMTSDAGQPRLAKVCALAI
ncbi:Uncharacterised protein [Achromobacter sp. 2789STDY5608628]|nr:Uncharacterised protein [Achromobacter sp. 2789STDY5608628]